MVYAFVEAISTYYFNLFF